MSENPPKNFNKLWNPLFTRLWGAESISFLAAQMFTFALPIIAVSYLNSSDSQVGLINTAIGIGTAAALMFFSSLADSSRKDLLLGFLSLSRSFTLGILSYSCFAGTLKLWHLLMAAGLVAGLTALYDSSFSATILHIVPVAVLPKANSWIAGLRAAADIGAGGLAGVILTATDSTILFTLLTVLYAFSSVAPFSLRKKFFHFSESLKDQDNEFATKGAWQGFKFLLKNPIQRSMTLAITHFNIFTSVIQTLYVVYALRYANLSAVEIGIAGSVGGILGLLAIRPSSWLISSVKPILLLSLTLVLPGLSGMVIIILPWIPQHLVVAALGGALGLWSGSILINIASCETIRQWLVPTTILGRLSAAIRLFTWGFDPLGAVIATVAVTLIPIRLVLVIGVIGLVLSFGWLVPSKSLRKLSPPSDKN